MGVLVVIVSVFASRGWLFERCWYGWFVSVVFYSVSALLGLAVVLPVDMFSLMFC